MAHGIGDRSHVAVLGAGIVGVSCAIYLQNAGYRVTLIDAHEPGQQASRGNAGVISAGAMVPLNTPNILRNLPNYMLNRSPAVRYDLSYILQNLGWLTSFLFAARPAMAREAARNLSQLTLKSRAEHLALMKEAGELARLRDTGWLKLARSKKSLDGQKFDLDIFNRYDVAAEKLSRDEVIQLEPCLKPVFEGGIWIKDAYSVDSPGHVTAAYAELFVRLGGEIQIGKVTHIERIADGGFRLFMNGAPLTSEIVVLAAGPWSVDLLRQLGYHFPMVFERGYHCHFTADEGQFLNRPIHDLDGGYALSSMERGFRVTTGIELAHRDNPPSPVQLERILPRVREAFPIKYPKDNKPWSGSRPSMPDSIPVIGEAPKHPGLWLAFGHGHIGFGTGPITGRIIAEMIAGVRPLIDVAPFSPSRFL